jgi:trimeric autotransporter adhesin
MSKSKYVNANVTPTYDTFAGWLDKTNQIVYDMGTTVLTVNTSATPDITSGNGFVNGYFGANTVYITSGLQGGTANTTANLAITSGLTVAGQTWASANVTVTGSVNTSVNVNTVGLLANNGVFNNNITVSNTATLNVASMVSANITSFANIASANITTLYVSSIEGVANLYVTYLSVGNSSANVVSNSTTISFSGGGSVNTSNYTGTSANSTLFAGQTLSTVQGWVTGNAATAYSNATAYADTKAATAYSNATSYTDTKAGVAYTNAIAIANASVSNGYWIAANALYANNAGGVGGVIVNTSSPSDGWVLAYSSAQSKIIFQNPATISVAISANSVVANSQLQAGSNGTAYVLNAYSNATSSNLVMRANNITLTVDSGAISLNSAAVVAGVFTVGNTTASANGVVANSTTIEVGNSSVYTIVNATSFSGTANNASYLGGSTLATIQSQITGNSSTAYSNATSYAASISGTAYSNAVSYAASIAGTAYSNATTYAASIAGTAYTNAVSTASSDATSKAATAYSNAVSVASGDATSKAGTAYSNAVTTAASDATSKASTAYSNAVSTASSDATSKAATAYSNAVTTASSDATSKAGTAYSNAVSTASSDATSKAATAYSNAVSYAASIAGTAYSNAIAVAAATYQTSAGLSANVAALSANNATYLGGATLSTVQGYVTSNASAAYSNATSYAASISGTAYSNAVSYVATNSLNAANSTNSKSINGAAGSVSGVTLQSGLGTSSSPQFASIGIGTAASGNTGEVRATGEITAYYSSDKQFKENIVPIESALDKLSKITGVMFDWTDEYITARGGEDGYFVRKHDTGVIAQDVQQVLPEVVATREDGSLAVKYEKMLGLVIQAINELSDKVNKLKGD